MIDEILILNRSVTNAGSLFLLAGDDASLLFDPDWRFRIFIELAIVEAKAKVLLELTSPRSLTRIHLDVLLAAEAYRDGAVRMANGLENYDLNDLESAVQLWARASGLAQDAAIAAQRICR